MSANSKKLTLEERLSLAAKKGKKKTRRSTSSQAASPPQSPVPAAITEEAEEAGGPSTNNACDAVNVEDQTSIQDDKGSDSLDSSSENPKHVDSDQELFKSLVRQDPWPLWLSNECSELSTLDLLKILQPHIQRLVIENEQLKTKQNFSDGKLIEGNFVKVIKEKDDLIDQLRKEGEKLSLTELRQSNLLKSARKKIAQLEEDLDNLQVEFSEKNSIYEEATALKENALDNLKNAETKISKLTEENQDLMRSKNSLVDKEKNFEDMKKVLESKCMELSDITLKYEEEIKSQKATYEEQVLNLESNLEQLRIELERASNRNISSRSGVEMNLQVQYDRLCEELASSKANARAIENALNNKVSALENQLTDNNHELMECRKKLKDAAEQKGELGSQLDKTESDKLKYKQDLDKLHFETSSLKCAIQTLKDDYELLERKYEIQRIQLEQNIDGDKNQGSIQLPIPFHDKTEPTDSLVSKVEDNWLLSQNSSSLPHMETPRILKEGFSNKDDDSIVSQNDKFDLPLDMDDIPDEATELASLSLENRSFRNTSSRNLNKYDSEAGSSAHMNGQMVRKLGAEIRKFEVELASLQSLNDKTQQEKNEANNEILRLLEENEKLNLLKEQNDELSNEVNELQRKLDTSLQILGEKTELVEELQNDVADLKEMMRQQIQEMLKLKESG